MDKEEKDWIRYIKEGGNKELSFIYKSYREEFLLWSTSNYHLQEETAADIFQDAVITLYWNVKQEKLTELTSSLKTYLFAIGKNLALKKIKKDKKLVIDDEVTGLNASVTYSEMPLEYDQRHRIIGECVAELGEPCCSILSMFYFDRFTMDSISRRLGHKNENVTKTQKLRCLQKLKKLMQKRSLNVDEI